MKSKKFYISFIAILVVLLCTTNFAFAKPIASAAFKTGIVKLSLAMLGVFVFTIIMTVGLSLYNRFFVPNEIKNYKLGKHSLRGPSDKDEAIIMYLTKNKLR